MRSVFRQQTLKQLMYYQNLKKHQAYCQKRGCNMSVCSAVTRGPVQYMTLKYSAVLRILILSIMHWYVVQYSILQCILKHLTIEYLKTMEQYILLDKVYLLVNLKSCQTIVLNWAIWENILNIGSVLVVAPQTPPHLRKCAKVQYLF